MKKLLERFVMSEARPAPTPAVERPPKVEEKVEGPNGGEVMARGGVVCAAGDKRGEQGEEESKSWLRYYGSLIGALLYLSLSTRPDITQAVVRLSRHLKDPSLLHWTAAKRVLRYAKGTASMGLTFGGSASSSQQVCLGPVYCDADWAQDPADRRSTTGYITKINGGTVSWASKKQTTIALSSAEAEYMAAGAAVQEILWLRTLLSELGWRQEAATVLLCDNQAAIALASDDVHHARTKHIDVRHHFIREHAAAGAVKLEWVSTKEQQADILTKPLHTLPFTHLRSQVMGRV